MKLTNGIVSMKRRIRKLWKERKAPLILLGLILMLGTFVRVLHYTDRIPMENEPVRDAAVGLVGARELQAPITGPFSSLGPFTFGPWYWYHLIAGSMVFPTPYAPFITQTFLSVASLLVYFCIGLLVHGWILGILMALFAALSPSHITAALHLTQPNMLSFYSGIVILVYIVLVSRRVSQRWGLLFGMALGIAINIHYQAVNLGLLVVGLALWSTNRIRQIGWAAAGFAIVNVPLLIFNLLNHWQHLRNVLYFMVHGKEIIYVPNSWTLYTTQFWPHYWADFLELSVPAGVGLGMLSAGAVIAEMYSRRNTRMIRVVAGFIVIFVALRYYWGERLFSYMTYLHPFLYCFAALPFAVGLVSRRLSVRMGAMGLLILFLFSFGSVTYRIIQVNPASMYLKEIVQAIWLVYPDDPVSLYNCRHRMASRDYSVMFLLSAQDKLGEGGAKIGFSDEPCVYPLVDSSEGTEWTGHEGRPRTDYEESNEILRSVNLMDFSQASESSLSSRHWANLTPEFLYDISTKWWYEEKP